jgi:hypothetical protein
MSTTMTEPATSGRCGVAGCDHGAVLQTTARIGANRWEVSRTCLEHASAEDLARAAVASER